MASEIRVNKINSRTGVGTITLSPTGVDFTGIATVATLKATTGIVTTFSATGNATVGGTLGVTGTSTLSGNATVGGTLNVTGETTFATHINLGDSDKAKFGASGDLEIYHDGTNSYIDDTGTGSVNIRGNTGVSLRNYSNSNQFINCYTDGAVELFHNNNKKFETTASGVTVTGAFNVGSATSITSSSLKVNDVQYPDSGPLSNRNLIINGDFQVAQRATSATSNSYATVDRWKSTFSQTAGTQSQLAFTSGDPYDEGFRYAYRLQVTSTSNNTSAYVQMQTHLEAQEIARSGWKYKDSNRSLSCSFWVRSSLAGTYNVQYRADDVGSFFFNRAFTVAADTWTKVTHTIPGHASLVFDNNHNSGLVIVIVAHYGTQHTGGSVSNNTWFSLSGGSYFPDYAQNWGNTANATFDVTGVQLEVGSKATPFEHRSYGDMLAKCQRYFYRHATSTSGASRGIGVASLYTASQGYGTVFLPVTMRAAPTVVSTDITDSFQLYSHGSGKAFNKFILQESNHTSPTVYANLNSNGTQGDAGWWRVPDGSTASLSFEAEL